MTPPRRRLAADGSAWAGIALGALALTAATDATADGESTPMFGGAIIGGRGPDPRAESVGLELEAAWWYGRLGLALEGASHWNLADDGARATVLGSSARLRVLERMVPALLEPRDVELGLELHGIVERTWWNDDRPQADPIAYGLGLALRLRGVADAEFSPLLTESRFFVRVLSSHPTGAEPLARSMSPAGAPARELTILFGIGAAFGAGDPRYLERFRLHPFEVPLGR
jgi:hypothetical protein